MLLTIIEYLKYSFVIHYDMFIISRRMHLIYS